MNPIGLYLAATDAARTYGPDAGASRRPRFAAVDALPLPDASRESRLVRLTAVLRQRVARSRVADDRSGPQRQSTVTTSTGSENPFKTSRRGADT